MGGSYGSVQFRTDHRDRVKRAADSVARGKSVKCLVGPALKGWVGVYPENAGQDESVGEALAREFGGDVLHLIVHDDDVFAYWLWHDGALSDSFYDPPGYFGDEGRAEQEGMTGNPEALRKFLAAGKKPTALAEILRRDREGDVFQAERLKRFATLLGIPNAVTSYEYLKEGGTEGIRGRKQFEEVPAGEIQSEKKAGAERRRQTTALKKRLRQSGLLLAEMVAKRAVPCCAAAGGGFVVAWYGPGTDKPAAEHFHPPWDRPRRIELPDPAYIHAMASDGAARRVAVTTGRRVVVYDAATWQPITEVPVADWAVAVALTSDGTLLAHSSREEVVITRVGDFPAGESRVATIPGSDRHRLALHPSGRWLVGATQLAVGVLDLAVPVPLVWRDLLMGGRETREEVDMPAELQEQIDVMHRMIDAHFKSLNVNVEAAKAEGKHPVRGKERPSCVGICADGKWMWCGTDSGLRVYAWDAVVSAAGEEMPASHFRHHIPEFTEGWIRQGIIYAVAEEPGGNALVFAGLNGHVYRMDLASGHVRDLLAMPESEPVIHLHLSADGTAVAVCGRPELRHLGGKRDRRSIWSVWSYQELLRHMPPA